MSFDETSRRSVDEAQGTFGELLRRAREARGLALDAVAGATRIARRYLEALERGDLDSLPAGPFGKGYIRSYAKVLGIDPEPILRDYRDRERERGVGTADEERRTLEQLSRLIRSGESRKRPLRVPTRSVSLALALALVLALTLSLGILGMRGWILARSRVPEGPDPPISRDVGRGRRGGPAVTATLVPAPHPSRRGSRSTDRCAPGLRSRRGNRARGSPARRTGRSIPARNGGLVLDPRRRGTGRPRDPARLVPRGACRHEDRSPDRRPSLAHAFPSPASHELGRTLDGRGPDVGRTSARSGHLPLRSHDRACPVSPPGTPGTRIRHGGADGGT